MKLTIHRLVNFSDQDHIDLGKIWPEYSPSSLRVREVTRRRGVGQYLVEEVIRHHPDVTSWWMADVGVEDRSAMAAFMQALGFVDVEMGWEKR